MFFSWELGIWRFEKAIHKDFIKPNGESTWVNHHQQESQKGLSQTTGLWWLWILDPSEDGVDFQFFWPFFHEDNDDWPVDCSDKATLIGCVAEWKKTWRICSGLQRKSLHRNPIWYGYESNPRKNPMVFPYENSNLWLSPQVSKPRNLLSWRRPTNGMALKPNHLNVDAGGMWGCPERGWCDERRDSNRNWYPHMRTMVLVCLPTKLGDF